MIVQTTHRSVLLVEHNDGVFVQIANDLAAVGIRVVRATNAPEAIRCYVAGPADLLLINADQPCESAWLLTAKLRLTHPTARVWVYASRMSNADIAMANAVGVDELIDHGGNVKRVVERILERLADFDGLDPAFHNEPDRPIGVTTAA